MTQKHETRAHSSKGASGAFRMIACPGSVQAQAGRPNPSNEAAARGTAAHELADKCLSNGYDAVRFAGEVITVEQWDFEVDDKMIDGVQIYLDTCRADVEPGDAFFTETRVDLSHLHPDLFGTNDWAVYKRKTKHLIVRDYKNGYGVVEAARNPQLLYYALGTWYALGEPKVDRITIGIVQPNAPHVHGPVRTWDCDILDLLDFERELVAAANRADAPDAKRIAGSHCEYCLAAADCPALSSRQMQFAAAEFEPVYDIPVEKLAQLLEAATMMDARLKAAWAMAQNLAEQGIEIPGYKLVERKTRRKWSTDDEHVLAGNLRNTYDFKDEDLYVRKLKSPAQIEKLLKAPRGQTAQVKAEFNDNFCTRPPAGKTLARDVDPRVALSAADPAADFEPITIDGQSTELMF